MTARELFKKQLNPAPCWTEQTISFDFEDVVEFAEKYYKYKLENCSTSKQRCDHTVTEQVKLRCTCCVECGEILDVID